MSAPTAGAEAPTVHTDVPSMKLPDPTIQDIIAFYMGDSTWVDIAQHESNFNTRAYNPEWHYDRYGNKVCQGSYGLMQIACVHHNGNPEDLYDLKLNLDYAQKIYKSQGIYAWGVCRSKVDCTNLVY